MADVHPVLVVVVGVAVDVAHRYLRQEGAEGARGDSTCMYVCMYICLIKKIGVYKCMYMYV